MLFFQNATKSIKYVKISIKNTIVITNAFGYNYENKRKSVCLNEENYCNDFVYLSGDDYVLRLLVFVG